MHNSIASFFRFTLFTGVYEKTRAENPGRMRGTPDRYLFRAQMHFLDSARVLSSRDFGSMALQKSVDMKQALI